VESFSEIRRLDTQLDHLSKYMDRVEQRLQEHNDKLMATLQQQREDREKRRRSFHEVRGFPYCKHTISGIPFLRLFQRLEANQKEDDDFQQQLSTIMKRVGLSRNRDSLILDDMPEEGVHDTGEEDGAKTGESSGGVGEHKEEAASPKKVDNEAS